MSDGRHDIGCCRTIYCHHWIFLWLLCNRHGNELHDTSSQLQEIQGLICEFKYLLVGRALEVIRLRDGLGEEPFSRFRLKMVFLIIIGGNCCFKQGRIFDNGFTEEH